MLFVLNKEIIDWSGCRVISGGWLWMI